MDHQLSLSLICFVTMTFVLCHGYSTGPPNDKQTCKDMFPRGHSADARSDTPPFTFTLNQTYYNPGDVIEVFLDSLPNPANSEEWFMEGVLIQARNITQNCVNVTSHGTFQVPENDIFLKTMNCFDQSDNALRHYSHYHIYNRTFTWTAPAQPVGHVYLRATVARNQKKFWTNVFSAIIMDASSSSTVLTRCPVRTQYYIRPITTVPPTDSAMSVYASISLLTAALLLCCKVQLM